jgi:hypothetical protein
MPSGRTPKRRLGRRVFAVGAGVVTLAAPMTAFACPYCAGNGGGSTARGVLLGAFVFFPFAVVAAIIRIIKAGSRDA